MKDIRRRKKRGATGTKEESWNEGGRQHLFLLWIIKSRKQAKEKRRKKTGDKWDKRGKVIPDLEPLCKCFTKWNNTTKR